MPQMRMIRYSKASKEHGQMLCVDTYDAMRIIESLAAQVKNQSPNAGRAEFWVEVESDDTDNHRREYFSISVINPPKE